MPECGRRAPGPRRMRIARRDVPPRLRRRVVLSAVARYAVGSVPIGRLAGIRTWRCAMSDFWRQCEGQVIDNRFRLRHYLGGTDDSAVFLTQLPDAKSPKAAIKFVPAGPTAETQISLWLRIMQLAHPHLLRIFDVGRCRLENRDRLYVVMEYAEEDLSQIIPQRALAPSEAREMLEPVLDALVHLHSNGLVHSRIKPSNVLAAADQLKLSSDSLLPIGESRKPSHKFDAHDAPETATSPLSPAADVSQSISPLAVPLSTVPAVPAAKLQAPSSDVPPAKPKAEPPGPQTTNPAKQTLVLPNYVVPVAAGLLVIVAIFALPRILGRRSESSSSAASAAVQPATQPSAVEQPAHREAPPGPKPSAAAPKLNSPKTTPEKKTVAQPQPVAAPTPASVRTGTFASANAPNASAPSAARAEVLEQVFPDASAKALATIHGVVRVSVRVQVDPTGNVSEAALDSAGPSRYFADLALQAARRWQFTSPEVGGHSVPSEWLIRFHFTPSGPKAIPTQTAP